MHGPIAMHAPCRELAAVGVQRQHTIAGDPRTTLDERAGLAVTAYPQRFQPREGEKCETVIQLGKVEVGGLQLRARPHLRGRIRHGHLWVVVAVEPATRTVGPADRLYR